MKNVIIIYMYLFGSALLAQSNTLQVSYLQKTNLTHTGWSSSPKTLIYYQGTSAFAKDFQAPTNIYHKDHNSHLFTYKDKGTGNMGILSIQDSLRSINWILKKETKKIGGYTCHKAVGLVHNHLFTAWFTPDIPVSDGPWRLHGLPGLILEANDDKEEFEFIFSGIKMVPINESIRNIVKVPTPNSNGKYTSFDSFQKQYSSIIRNRMAAQYSTVEIPSEYKGKVKGISSIGGSTRIKTIDMDLNVTYSTGDK